MRKTTLGILLPVLMIAAAALGGGLFLTSAGAAPAPPFTECPPIGFDTGCALLLYVNAQGQISVLSDPNQGPYEQSDDTLIGILNDSNSGVSAIALQSTTTGPHAAFAFDGDGACSGVNSNGGNGFQPPPSACPYGSTGYEGPNTAFSGISTDTTQGTVNFAAPLSGGQHTWFSLEGQVTASSLTILKANPTLTTSTPVTATYGAALSDSATLAGGTSPSGTLSFALFKGSSSCTGATAYTSGPIAVTGNATYQSGQASNVAPGSYEWQATYSGDTNNNQVSSACGSEPVSVGLAVPGLTTTASAPIMVGGAVSDIAHLTGGLSPKGTITFQAFGPNDSSCATADGTYQVAVNGDGNYPSPSFTPATAGTYSWTATYNGDANNAVVTEACGAPSESVVVSAPTKATIDLSTTPAGGRVGGTISDAALVKSGNTPGGTLTFSLYGPNAGGGCVGPLQTSAPVAVHGDGTYPSPAFTPAAPGTYQFVATYSGDNLNNGAMGSCTDQTERVAVAKATPTLTTDASVQGIETSDTAHLAGGDNPTGKITFQLYNLANGGCAATGSANHVTVQGDGDYLSPSATPGVGTYVWRASYVPNGDPDNNAVSLTPCNDAREKITIVPAKAVTSISTHASGSVPAGDDIFDTALLSGGNHPTGQITFVLYGPGDTSCSQAPYDSTSVTVSGNGSSTSDFYTTVLPGTYRYTASYSGDQHNQAAVGACNAPNESVEVTPTIMTGRAYAAGAEVNALGALGLTIGPLADTGHVATPDASSTKPCTVQLIGLVRADVLCASVDTFTSPHQSVTKADVANVTIHLGEITDLLGLGDITADVIDTRSTTNCSGSTGSTTIANLKIDGSPVATATVGPNTSITVRPGIVVVLDEQTPVPGGLMVNAIHLEVNLLGVQADVVVASSTSDIHNCP